MPSFLYIFIRQSKNPAYFFSCFCAHIILLLTVSDGYVSNIAKEDEKYANSHLSNPCFFPLNVSNTPKLVPLKIATPAIDIELPIYKAFIPPIFTVFLIELMMVVLLLPMLLDKQFRACSIG